MIDDDFKDDDEDDDEDDDDDENDDDENEDDDDKVCKLSLWHGAPVLLRAWRLTFFS